MAEERNAGLQTQAAVAFGALIAFGLILGGWVLGAQIKATRLSDRYVAVKGLVERTVKSDLAIWPISFKEAGNDLPQVYAKSQADKEAVLKFLDMQGIPKQDIDMGQIRVVDTQANEYGGSNRAPNRYIVEQQITVRSANVDKVAAAGQKTADLVQAGIVLSSNPGQGGITYKFNGLNSIKPDMITEATKNARAAADRFAADSGSSVGAIRQANQGTFTILPADSGGDGDYGGGYQADSSMMKKVRVVATVEYYLDK